MLFFTLETQLVTAEAINPTTDKVLREIEIRIPPGKTPERLDVFLTRQVGELTRSRAQEAILSGAVTINDNGGAKPSHKVRPGEVIRLRILSRPPYEAQPEPIPINVVWEDEWLVIIDKPAGMVVHPAAGNKSGTLVNALLSHYRELPPSGSGPERPGLVHRLDKNTSGLIVVCKREPALSRMATLFRNHTIRREYQAIVWWPFKTKQGLIDQPLGRDPRDRKKYAVRPDGKVARTRWTQLEKFDFLSHASLRLETGRTHQIRVHLSSQGHPVFGDPDYSGRNRQMGKLSSAQRKTAAGYLETVRRQLLHAVSLGFIHPMTQKELFFESPLPDDFTWLLNQLQNHHLTQERLISATPLSPQTRAS